MKHFKLIIVLGALIVFNVNLKAENKAQLNPEIQNLEQFARYIMWGDDEKAALTYGEELEKKLADKEHFTKIGNFYKVKGEFKVFGFNATYLGTAGYDMLIGPNALLDVKPSELIDKIEGVYKIKFKKIKSGYLAGGFTANYTNKMFIYITAAENNKNTSIIVGCPNTQE